MNYEQVNPSYPYILPTSPQFHAYFPVARPFAPRHGLEAGERKNASILSGKVAPDSTTTITH